MVRAAIEVGLDNGTRAIHIETDVIRDIAVALSLSRFHENESLDKWSYLIIIAAGGKAFSDFSGGGGILGVSTRVLAAAWPYVYSSYKLLRN